MKEINYLFVRNVQKALNAQLWNSTRNRVEGKVWVKPHNRSWVPIRNDINFLFLEQLRQQ